jgi:hypothetical protein
MKCWRQSYGLFMSNAVKVLPFSPYPNPVPAHTGWTIHFRSPLLGIF